MVSLLSGSATNAYCKIVVSKRIIVYQGLFIFLRKGGYHFCFEGDVFVQEAHGDGEVLSLVDLIDAYDWLDLMGVKVDVE